MSSLAAALNNPTAVSSQVFTGRWRWVASVILIIGPLLQAVEFLLATTPDDNAARVAWWAANLSRTEWSMASGLLAAPFLLGGTAILVTLTQARSPLLAWTGGVLLTFAMVGLAAAHGYELAAYGLTQAGNLAAATSVLSGENLGLPGVVLFAMFIGGAALGTVAMAAAIWLSPLVPRIAAAFLLAFAVLDFALGQGVVSHLVNLVGFAIVAYAVVTGYSRQPR